MHAWGPMRGPTRGPRPSPRPHLLTRAPPSRRGAKTWRQLYFRSQFLSNCPPLPSKNLVPEKNLSVSGNTTWQLPAHLPQKIKWRTYKLSRSKGGVYVCVKSASEIHAAVISQGVCSPHLGLTTRGSGTAHQLVTRCPGMSGEGGGHQQTARHLTPQLQEWGGEAAPLSCRRKTSRQRTLTRPH